VITLDENINRVVCCVCGYDITNSPTWCINTVGVYCSDCSPAGALVFVDTFQKKIWDDLGLNEKRVFDLPAKKG
jgi:hypothetical protein